jgi:DNA polymerase III delta prime subunit
LVDITGGDLRRSINTLQTASSFKKQLTPKDIESISGIVSEDVIHKIEKILTNTDGFSEVQSLT